ncbi:MAG: hypothetical protein ACM3SR_11730 [Ignavibacteriales bacterium]
MEDLKKERPSSNFSKFESLEDWENYEKYLNYQDKKAPYIEVNECLKKFVKDRDLDYLLDIVGLLWVDAFGCPPFVRVLSILREKYASATRYHTKKSKEVTAIKKFAQDIGEALLDRARFNKLDKVELLLDGLKDRHHTLEGARDYIRAKSAGHLKKLRHRDKEEVLEHDRKLLKQTQCRLEQERSKGNLANPKRIKELEREVKRLDSNILKHEKEENEAHKEAARRTIAELYKETGVEIGLRNLWSITTKKPGRPKLLDLK